jgi:regulator of PEP synthase PpsR (kinase-PPPase family)
MKKIFAISDASGKTAEGALRAALTQYDARDVEIIRYGGIRTEAQVRDVIQEARQTGALSCIPWFPSCCAVRCSPKGGLPTWTRST